MMDSCLLVVALLRVHAKNDPVYLSSYLVDWIMVKQ